MCLVIIHESILCFKSCGRIHYSGFISLCLIWIQGTRKKSWIYSWSFYSNLPQSILQSCWGNSTRQGKHLKCGFTIQYISTALFWLLKLWGMMNRVNFKYLASNYSNVSRNFGVGGARNMKYRPTRSATIFFITIFYRPGGAWLPCPPPPGIRYWTTHPANTSPPQINSDVKNLTAP